MLSDHLGSSSVVAKPDGTLVLAMCYFPWGETRYSSGSTPTDYKYTGQREESGIGLYYYGARWYSPYHPRAFFPQLLEPLSRSHSAGPVEVL